MRTWVNVDLHPGAVDRVLAVEPSDETWQMSETVRRQATVPIERSGLDGAPSPSRTARPTRNAHLHALHDPCRRAGAAWSGPGAQAGGTIHLAEHGLSPDPAVVAWQHRLDGVQQRVFGGCHLTRDPRALLAAGFADIEVDSGYVEGMPRISGPWAYGYAGTARRP